MQPVCPYVTDENHALQSDRQCAFWTGQEEWDCKGWDGELSSESHLRLVPSNAVLVCGHIRATPTSPTTPLDTIVGVCDAAELTTCRRSAIGLLQSRKTRIQLDSGSVAVRRSNSEADARAYDRSKSGDTLTRLKMLNRQ